MNWRSALILAAVVGVAVSGHGCSSDPREGYSFNSSFRSDVKTVAVPVWTNNTFYHGMETKLAQALVTEINKTTPYKVTSNGNAGTVLEGTITSVNLRQLSTSPTTGLGQEMSLEVVCNFTWRDSGSNKVLTARRDFMAARSFVPANGVRERIDVGEDAAVQQLARDIIGEMRSGW